MAPGDWAVDAVQALEAMIPEPQKELLDIALAAKIDLKEGGTASLDREKAARRHAKKDSENGTKADLGRLGF